MSKNYRNKETGLLVTSGTISAISEDRTTLTIAGVEYDVAKKAEVAFKMDAQSMLPFDESYRVGSKATAIGYQAGAGKMNAQSVLTGNATYETDELLFLRGKVKKVFLNEEKNEDGTPKMKKDGVTPRKRHLDITVAVPDGEKWVNHTVKIYGGNANAGKVNQIDATLKKFTLYNEETKKREAWNPEKDNAYVSIVTKPGEERTWTSTNPTTGKEYINYICDHLGYNSLDVEFEPVVERTYTTTQENVKYEPPKTPPTQSTPTQEVSAPRSEGNGMMEDAFGVDLADDFQ